MPSTLQVLFNGHSPRGTLTRFELRQSYEKHTVALLDMTVSTAQTRAVGGLSYTEMTPVQVDWGASTADRSRFYGYVNHAEILTDDQGVVTVRHLCLGTSLRMNNVEPRAWNAVSPSYVAAEIARKHRLRALLHRCDRILPTFTLTTETDFQALQRLADESGFRLWIDGGTLHFVDPAVLITGAATSFVPRYTNLTSFAVTFGSLAPRENGVISEKAVLGRHPVTGKRFTVTAGATLKDHGGDLTGRTPLLTTVLPGIVSSYAEARDRVQAAARQHSWLTATVKIPGAPRAQPGRLVDLDGPSVPVDYAGVWQVESARHVMNINSRVVTHSTEISVSRNAGDRPVFERNSQLSGTPEQIGCVHRDGVFWESELLDIVHLN